MFTRHVGYQPTNPDVFDIMPNCDTERRMWRRVESFEHINYLRIYKKIPGDYNLKEREKRKLKLIQIHDITHLTAAKSLI